MDTPKEAPKATPKTVPTTWTDKDAEMVAQYEMDVLAGLEKKITE